MSKCNQIGYHAANREDAPPACAEFTEVFQIETDFKEKVEAEFNEMIAKITASHEDKNAMEA